MRGSRRAQRGVALLGLLAVAVMVFAYVLTSRLNAASMFVGIDRNHNAQVMARAKQALVGWMAMNAAGTDPSPGRLPCPEAPADFNTVNEGSGAGNCALPAVGRLPWRQLGLEKLVDAAGEPLWYVVSPGWALASGFPPVKPTINSDSVGQLGLNGNPVVALIIAPGAALTTEACGGASARSQARPVAGPPDLRDYFECGNANSPVDTAFVRSAPGNTFNDQVLAVRASDLIPALEAAIQQRMQREIAPALKNVYASATQWGTSSTNPLYPFATPFGDPGTSNSYQGVNDRYQGLLPFSCSATNCATDARYSPTFVSWRTSQAPTVSISGEIAGSGSCTFPTPTTVECTGTYLALGMVTLRMVVRADNVAMALRQLDPNSITIEHGLLGCGSPGPGSSATAVLQDDGSAQLTLQGTAPGLLGPLPLLLPLTTTFCMTATLGVLADHSLLDESNTTTGWFVRNEWYRLVYYAAARESTADGLPSYGCDSTDCLRINELLSCGGGAEWCNIRALLVLGGASLSNTSRPNGNVADYFENQNADGGTSYEQRPIRRTTNVANPNAPWNDRLILVDWLPPPSPPLIDVARSVIIGRSAQVYQASDSPPRTFVLP